jgi:quercetin dioxygenase-like cupin family protein
MPLPKEERRREYPGDRFSQRVLEQDLGSLADRLQDEEFGDGHLEQGHNQIELYRQDGTTVSLFVMNEGAELPEHSVSDGSVMIQVLDGDIEVETGDSEEPLSSEENSVVTLGPGIKHKVRAQTSSRLMVTIMR